MRRDWHCIGCQGGDPCGHKSIVILEALLQLDVITQRQRLAPVEHALQFGHSERMEAAGHREALQWGQPLLRRRSARCTLRGAAERPVALIAAIAAERLVTVRLRRILRTGSESVPA